MNDKLENQENQDSVNNEQGEVAGLELGAAETGETEQPVADQNQEVQEEAAEASDAAEKPTKPAIVFTPEQMALPWYAVHTYSGFESRVKIALEEKVRTGAVSKKFGNIVIPQETTEELVRGKKKAVTRKIYPGYIMVQMLIDDETWHLLNNIPKVSGFVGDPRNPLPLSESEVADLLGHLDGTTVSKSKSRKSFEEGDQVKVIDGPFAEFSATVESVNLDKSKLKVLISIFGRNTPVELDFSQVEKV
jgi:transcriptional antiterminator NusG